GAGEGREGRRGGGGDEEVGVGRTEIGALDLPRRGSQGLQCRGKPRCIEPVGGPEVQPHPDLPRRSGFRRRAGRSRCTLLAGDRLAPGRPIPPRWPLAPPPEPPPTLAPPTAPP